jgi:hypothetical protein
MMQFIETPIAPLPHVEAKPLITPYVDVATDVIVTPYHAVTNLQLQAGAVVATAAPTAANGRTSHHVYSSSRREKTIAEVEAMAISEAEKARGGDSFW